MDASVQRCRLLDLGPICEMQCSSEQVQRTLASVKVAAKYFLSLRKVLSHRSRSAYVICNNVLEITQQLEVWKEFMAKPSTAPLERSFFHVEPLALPKGKPPHEN